MPRLNDPYEDPTQGITIAHEPAEDPTQGRVVGSDPYEDLVRHSARLAHQRNKLRAIKRELRSLPAEIGDSLHLAAVQLTHAIDALDRAAGKQDQRD
jgi:hypothetical protein